jgi:hypothetical protein
MGSHFTFLVHVLKGEGDLLSNVGGTLQRKGEALCPAAPKDAGGVRLECERLAFHQLEDDARGRAGDQCDHCR